MVRGLKRVASVSVDEDVYKRLVSIAREKNKTLSAVLNAFIAYALKHFDDPELQAFIEAEKVKFTKPIMGSYEERLRRYLGIK